MIQLSIDLSLKPGFAWLEVLSRSTINHLGSAQADYPDEAAGGYPKGLIRRVEFVIDRLFRDLTPHVERHGIPDRIVIEETNLGRANGRSQKVLEWLHLVLCLELESRGWLDRVSYVYPSAWRKAINLQLSPEQKANNRVLSKMKSLGKTSHAEKVARGIKGKITKKHLAVQKANDLFDLDLKRKDEDRADAICLGVGAALGADVCV